MYTRNCTPLKSRSFFLFGARGTGKSTLLKHLFEPQETYWFDLLDYDLETRLQTNPGQFMQILDSVRENKSVSWIVIDEIQKVPGLLNYVQKEIGQSRFKFALTGSSARKLKRGAANLLAGRALQNFLYPLSVEELGKDFDLNTYLTWGGLPEIYSLSQEERRQYLRTYVQTYLREEIQAEQLVRNLPPFRAFLDLLGQISGTILNYSKIARDINSDPVSVKNYFEILEDTLIGFRLPSFHKSIRKRQMSHPKFYLFDLGVRRALMGQVNLELETRSYSYGITFEHFIIQEIIKINSYQNRDWQLSYLRTKDDVEVDLIIERPGLPTIAVEIKSTDKISADDVKGFSRLTRDLPKCQSYCVSNDKTASKIEGVSCLHWRDFMTQIKER
jgi:predicted AAA+ superfamily ATPase